MKRKVKFQEGGVVETPAQRRVRLAEDARTRSLELRDFEDREGRRGAASRDAVRQFNQMPEVAARNERDTANQRRVGLAERAREREQARQAAAREEARVRAEAQRDVARFNERVNRAMPVTPEEARRLGAEPARPSANRALAEVGTPRQPMVGRTPTPMRGPGLPAVAATVAPMALAAVEEPLMRYGRATMDRRAEEARAAGAQRMQAVRNRELDAMREALPAGPNVEAEQAARGPAPSPAPRRREMTANRLNELAMGAEPTTPEERMAQMRMQGRRQELEERGTAFKKGGMVKPKAAPKKMMKGGIVAKPKSKAKPAAKPVPFKKGGVIKKGRK